MSNLPPPPFGQDGSGNQPPQQPFSPPSFSPPPGAPTGATQAYEQQPYGQPYPPTGQQPFQAGGPPPSGGNNKKKIALGAGIVVVAALVAGGIYVATNDNEEAVTDTTVEFTVPEFSLPDITVPVITVPETIPDTTVPDTTIPDTTIPDTTVPDTTIPESTIPEGAIDVGGGVYVQLPSGWSDSTTGDVTTITDGTTSVAVQVLEREPDEDPAAVFQEYGDTFDTDFPAVSFTQASLEDEGGSVTPWVMYRQFYKTFDQTAANGIGYQGDVKVYQRGDGLTMILDEYTTSDSLSGLPEAENTALQDTFSAAPVLNDSTTITRRDPFRTTQAAPFVDVEQLSGFTAAPGFSITTSGDAHGEVTNAVLDFQVLKVLASTNQSAAINDAQGKLLGAYPDAVFSAPTEQAADQYGVIQMSSTWNGTYLDGRPAAGTVDVYFDPATTNSYAIYRTWFLVAPGDFTEQNAPEGAFMYRSFYDSFTNVP